MTITTLDPRTALVVIDLQKGIAALPTAHPIADVVSCTNTLAEAFRGSRLPVVLVNVAGGALGRTEQGHTPENFPDGWADLLPELKQQPDDHIVTKRTWGAFTHTDLELHLRGVSVTQIVIVGVATSIGVESTARQAYGPGFNVTLAVDAMTDLNSDAHDNSVARIFPLLGEVGSCHAIIDLLKQRTNA
jgi:nicotinamidase-related amidase